MKIALLQFLGIIMIVLALAACGNAAPETETTTTTDETATESGTTNTTNASSEAENETKDYTFAITFSTGYELTQENGDAENRSPNALWLTFDTGSLQELERVTITFDAETLEVGDVGVSRLEAVAQLEEPVGEVTAVACLSSSISDTSVTITEVADGRASGNFSFTLDACRDAIMGGTPIEGQTLEVSGEFSNVPYLPNS